MRTVFLDRDGVINRKLPGEYVRTWDEFEFLPGVFDALRELKAKSFRLIVVTNQRGISLGKLHEDELRVLHERMKAEFQTAGISLDAIYYCPHNYDSCQCRKPEIGLFLQARRDFPEIEFAESYVIGDSISDIEAGVRLGCKTILVGTDTQGIFPELAARNLRVDFVAPSLIEVVRDYLLERAV